MFSLWSTLGKTLSQMASAQSQQNNDIDLIQPLTGGTSGSISYSDGLPIFTYITTGLAWLQEVAVGLVILWLVFAGISYMISGNDQARTQAKDHAVAAIIGLLMLFLLGFILTLLNANFFKQ